jgi:hypothetical protein
MLHTFKGQASGNTTGFYQRRDPSSQIEARSNGRWIVALIYRVQGVRHTLVHSIDCLRPSAKYKQIRCRHS